MCRLTVLHHLTVSVLSLVSVSTARARACCVRLSLCLPRSVLTFCVASEFSFLVRSRLELNESAEDVSLAVCLTRSRSAPSGRGPLLGPARATPLHPTQDQTRRAPSGPTVAGKTRPNANHTVTRSTHHPQRKTKNDSSGDWPEHLARVCASSTMQTHPKGKKDTTTSESVQESTFRSAHGREQSLFDARSSNVREAPDKGSHRLVRNPRVGDGCMQCAAGPTTIRPTSGYRHSRYKKKKPMHGPSPSTSRCKNVSAAAASHKKLFCHKRTTMTGPRDHKTEGTEDKGEEGRAGANGRRRTKDEGTEDRRH